MQDEIQVEKPVSSHLSLPRRVARSGLVVLQNTVQGRLLRLKLLAGEAQKLATDLFLGNYEQALDPIPTALTRRFDRRAKRIEIVADRVKALARELAEDLRRRVEASQRSLVASGNELPAKDLKTQLEEYERELILSALKACGMSQLLAAKILQVRPTTLNEKMKRLGLRSPRPRRGPGQRS
jgi:transcriptional regulator with GAF, ATPase, and Fis domain